MVVWLGVAGKGVALNESMTYLVWSEHVRVVLSAFLKGVRSGKKV